MTTASASAAPSIAQRLEALPQGAGLARLVARISAGGWFEFYDLFMTAYIALGLTQHGLFSALGSGIASVAAFVAASFAGMFVGTLLFGWVSDRFGRKVIFTYSLVFYSIATLVMALSPTAAGICAARLAAGVGIGVQIVTIDAYISEIAPRNSRGRYIAMSQAIGYTAVPVVAFLAYLLVPRVIGGLDGWRWVALAGSLGAIVIWPIAAGLPESPRWLARRGRDAQANDALGAIERAIGEARQTSGVAQEADILGSSPPALQTLSGEVPLAKIFAAEYRSRTILLAVFNVFQTIGFYGFAAWMPILLRERGMAVAQSLHYAAIIAIVTPIGPLMAMGLADRLERKLQIAVLACTSAACTLALAFVPGPWAIITFGSLITLANTWFSSAFHAYQSELYPTAVRAGGVGFVYSWSRLSSIFTGYLFAFVLRSAGVTAAFGVIAAAMLISATLVALFGPLTNRKQLEMLAP